MNILMNCKFFMRTEMNSFLQTYRGSLKFSVSVYLIYYLTEIFAIIIICFTKRLSYESISINFLPTIEQQTTTVR